MAETYLMLPREEQANILRAVAPELGQTPTVIEKDVWVCWVLKQLFEMPNRLPMAFKGGTSLSKVFPSHQPLFRGCGHHAGLPQS